MSDIPYTVIVSDKAKKMLAEHVRFLARINKDAAKRTKNRIMDALRSLDHFPSRFPFFENDYIPRNKYHKMFVENTYLILYQIKDTTVYVDFIVDCRQDYAFLLK